MKNMIRKLLNDVKKNYIEMRNFFKIFSNEKLLEHSVCPLDLFV